MRSDTCKHGALLTEQCDDCWNEHYAQVARDRAAANETGEDGDDG